MHSDYLPIFYIVAFVVYPFVVTGICFWIGSRTGRARFVLPVAKLFAVVGCVIVAWFMLRYGLGKIPPVTIIGSAVFVFGTAATGGLIGAIADLFIPAPAELQRDIPNE